MIKDVTIGVLIIVVFVLVYFVYKYYSDKNDLIKNIQDIQNNNTLLKSKIVEINDKIILLELPGLNKNEKDNINNLKYNIDKLLDEYKVLNDNSATSLSKISQYTNDLNNLKSQLISIKDTIKTSNISNNYFTNISTQEVKDIASDLIIIINKYIENTKSIQTGLTNTNVNSSTGTTSGTTNNNTTTNTNTISQSQLIDIMNRVNTILRDYNNSGITINNYDYETLNRVITNNNAFIESINTRLDNYKVSNDNKTTNDLSKLILTEYINKRINDNLNIILDKQADKINELITINTDLKTKLTSLMEFDPSINTNTIQANDTLLNKDFSQPQTQGFSNNIYKTQGFSNNIYKTQGFSNPPNNDDITFLKNYIKSSKYSLDKGIQLLNSNFSQSTLTQDTTSKFSSINNFINLINNKIVAYNSLLNLYNTLNTNYNTLNKNIITVDTSNTYIPVDKLHGIIFLNRSITGNDKSSVLGNNRLLSIGDCLNNTADCYAYTNTYTGNFIKRNITNNIDGDMQLNKNLTDIRNTFINAGNYISSVQLINNDNIISVVNNTTDNTKANKYYNNVDILKHVLITNATINENDVTYITNDKNQAYFYYPSQTKTNNCIAQFIKTDTNTYVFDTSYSAAGAVMSQYNGSSDYLSGPPCKQFNIKSSTQKIRLVRSPDKAVYIYDPTKFDFSAL